MRNYLRRRVYSADRRSFHLYSLSIESGELRQRTDGPEDDFDPCPLPDGGIAFMSTRRGGFARCNNPWEPLPAYTLHRMDADGGNVRRSAGHLREAETQRELLTDRVETMVAEVGMALRPALKAPKEEAARRFNAQQHVLVECARAHTDLLLWEAFTAGLERVTDPGTRRVLTWVRDLFGLTVIERNLAWYLMHGRLSTGRASGRRRGAPVTET